MGLVNELTIRTDRLERRLLFVQKMLEKEPNNIELQERIADIQEELKMRSTHVWTVGSSLVLENRK